MPVYNSARFLHESVHSILRQSWTDFEFLIIDDGSEDSSWEYLCGFADARIRLLRNDKNLGLVSTLNRGLEHARGTYVARMDADDVALPSRLAAQVAELDRDPKLQLLGTKIRYLGRYVGTPDFRPTASGETAAFLLFASPIVHPTAMFRIALAESYGLRYSPEHDCTEDYEMWANIADYGKIANLDQVLLHYRLHDGGVTARRRKDMEEQETRIARRQLTKMGVTFSPQQLVLHRIITRAERIASLETLYDAEGWLNTLVSQFHQQELQQNVIQAAQYAWFRLCRNCGNLGLSAWRACFQSDLQPHFHIPFRLRFEFFLSCLLHAQLRCAQRKAMIMRIPDG